jgi:hypothetical protein
MSLSSSQHWDMSAVMKDCRQHQVAFRTHVGVMNLVRETDNDGASVYQS